MARTRASDYDDKRRSILDRSAELFSEHGYDRASMNRIAEACGVSKANLYHYYKDKNELLFDVIRFHLAELIEVVEAADDAGGPPRERLLRLIAALLEAYRDADAQHNVQINSMRFLPKERQAELKAMERELVALFAAATAFAVQTTLVFGAFSNAALQAMGGRRLDLSVSFLASALSVFLVVATCMPLGFRNQGARDKVLSIVRYLKKGVMAVLAVTAVTLGQEFLGGAAALALFPEITVAAMYYAVSMPADEAAAAADRKMEVLPTVVVATFGFGMLGAAYAALFGTPEYDLYTKALAFTLLTAVVSSLGRVAGPLCNAQRDKSSAAWVTFLSSILPIVEMLVAVPLAAKVMVDFLAVPGNG
jgi:AcrR family transcriptional regulator